MQIINATVFIQALNFGFTYFFLKKVLFKPVVQRIHQKELAKSRLLETLKEKDALLLRLQNEKAENLARFRQSVKKYYTVDVAADIDVPGIVGYKKDAAQLDAMSKQAKELLIEKVPYAY